MESDLGTKLEWAAAAHFNTGHPHVHVAIRGVAGGQALRFDREFIQHGIRRHAEELCTAQLGYRTTADEQEAQRREVDQPRLTSLDRIIRRAGVSHADNPNSFTVDVSHNGLVRPASQQLVIARLRVLTTMGVAAPQDSGSWSVRSDFESTLRAMQKIADRQKMIAAHAALLSDPRLPVQLTPANTISRLDGRVIGHSMDDSSGRTYLILEGTDAKVHLIPHTPEIEAARFAGELSANHFIEIRARHGARRLAIRDRGDADQFLTQQRLPSNRPEGNPNGWAGWLGRYLTTSELPRQRSHRVSK
ncbi:MAG: relaxase/mobilization nuclease domain-containing protein [Bryobacterales bacterium]|nr:relaxase/mobilization nuclease domain-containing protein [Bryobacterales bacterium]